MLLHEQRQLFAHHFGGYTPEEVLKHGLFGINNKWMSHEEAAAKIAKHPGSARELGLDTDLERARQSHADVLRMPHEELVKGFLRQYRQGFNEQFAGDPHHSAGQLLAFGRELETNSRSNDVPIYRAAVRKPHEELGVPLEGFRSFTDDPKIAKLHLEVSRPGVGYFDEKKMYQERKQKIHQIPEGGAQGLRVDDYVPSALVAMHGNASSLLPGHAGYAPENEWLIHHVNNRGTQFRA